jgi:BMFP domain-containing protein YqiC
MGYHFFHSGACGRRIRTIRAIACTMRRHRGDLRTSRVRPTDSEPIMDKTNFFNDLQDKINQAIRNSPAKDIEKNVKAMLTQGFSKLDLVTREEFDIQTNVLARTRAKLEALEARVAELEALLKKEP